MLIKIDGGICIVPEFQNIFVVIVSLLMTFDA